MEKSTAAQHVLENNHASNINSLKLIKDINKYTLLNSSASNRNSK